MNTRKTITFGDEHLIGEGNWVNLYKITTRRNGRFKAAKCLVLYVEENVWRKSPVINSNDLPTFLRLLHKIGLLNVHVFFLAVDRPCTYSESPDLAGLAENYQLEIPGGVADAADEDTIAIGLRETCEEYGCTAKDVAMTAPLVTRAYVAYDAGGQVEFYSTCVALVTKKPNPPRNKKGDVYREGIIPDKCVLVPLLKAEKFLMEQGRQGILLEGIALTSLFQLGLELHGVWRKLDPYY